MRFKRYILIIIACLSSVIKSSADITLPSMCQVSLPKMLSKPFIKESEVDVLINSSDWGQSKKSDRYWTAYSDRDDNTTYNNPCEDSICGKLAFNERVRIAEIRNGFALVYEETQMGSTYPAISRSAVSKGWVPMRNLLLWSSCPTNDAGIYHKALIVNNLDKTNNSNKCDLFKCYMNPKTRQKAFGLRSTMTFYFVMKKADGLVLLAKECKMEGYTSAVLHGWVNEANFVLCNQRTFLEPNWKPDVAREFEGKNLAVYKEASLSSPQIASIPLGHSYNIGNEAMKYRMHPGIMRYLLVDNDSGNDDFYKIICFATVSGKEAITKSEFWTLDQHHVEVDFIDSTDLTSYLEAVFTPQEILALQKNSTLMACQGYVEKRDARTSYDYFQPVIYISSDEFSQLMEKLAPVMSAANACYSDRKPYVEATKSLIRSMVPDITEKEMNEKDVKEVMAMIAGLNVMSGSLVGRSLIQIQDENIVKQDEFDGMISDFSTKYKKLQKIKGNKYDFSIERNKTTWYWIPVEDLP